MNDQKQLENVVGLLERFLREGKPEEADQWLMNAKPEELASGSILGALTITCYSSEENLPHRKDFLIKAETVLRERLGDERANNLLKNRRAFSTIAWRKESK